ncbi:SDR family NAD(P)-dependent oxidoreductase [Roseateles chitinivorans]|uniref:SDR family NAD(P)-dependent oxidoreductase n=1 Tax=Roseateles chitinivorans TaxID=2917965 RepID=UPI003D666E2F
MFKNDLLAGQRFLITGASSGLGRAAAELIAACGGQVLGAGRNAERLQAAIASWSGTGHVACVQELGNADATADWAKDLAQQHGPLNGIFHAAGTELLRPIRMSKQAQFDEAFGSAFFAAAGLARAAGQKGVMVDGGALVFMSSVAGSAGKVGMAAYSASRAAVEGMVRSLACEFAPRGIRVNAIAAGAVQTPMHDRITQGAAQEVVDAYASSHLLGFGEPGDIASAVVYLLGPAGRWITGTTMAVDGGYLCK